MSNHSVLTLKLLKYYFSLTCDFCPTCLKGGALVLFFFLDHRRHATLYDRSVHLFGFVFVFLQCFWSQVWSSILFKNYIVPLCLAFLIVQVQYNRINILIAEFQSVNFISRNNSIIRVPVLF